jgi:protein lifeguard
MSNKVSPSIVDDFMYGSNVSQAHVTVRLGFLRKVYGILSVQLLATTIISAIIMSIDGIKEYVQTK